MYGKVTQSAKINWWSAKVIYVPKYRYKRASLDKKKVLNHYL